MTIIKRAKLLPGQESVWDYPRPPRLEDCHLQVQVVANGKTIADSIRTKRVLETSHPPVFYIPPQDIEMDVLKPESSRSFCEWKGEAKYASVVVAGKSIRKAAWFYPHPTTAFHGIQGYVAFYPSKMDACFVDGERVLAQAGDFYGGWITSKIAGPFKGGPGTYGW